MCCLILLTIYVFGLLPASVRRDLPVPEYIDCRLVQDGRYRQRRQSTGYEHQRHARPTHIAHSGDEGAEK